MQHLFQKGTDESRPILLLLHGTGGNERDLLPIAKMIDDKASILSVRGNVLENGMPRFFRRLAEGIFDEEDLIFRTNELYQFLDEAAAKYEFNRQQIVAVGYSNGANIAASLLFHYKDALMGAILHHPMVPRRGLILPDLSAKQIFIGAGVNDPICPQTESKELQMILEEAGATVAIHWENQGHQLTTKEVESATKWYEQQYIAE